MEVMRHTCNVDKQMYWRDKEGVYDKRLLDWTWVIRTLKMDVAWDETVFLLQEVLENEVFQGMQLIQKLRDDQKCMKKFVPSSRSKATEDIISIGSFVEVLVLNHYVLVRKILGKLSKLQDEDAQNKTNIQKP
ncbi:hypothetical protein Tco_0681905 [Tanacetum coccineum]|uniref:Uncharacterized protein n=1 Tax=Tanacetum coccineum TaxID=301880 RepID=A0ABQ4XQJ7_9ASTR